MRDYKFRGKRIVNGEWVHGYYHYDVQFNRAYIKYECTINNDNFIETCEVIPETVSQYTGLHDKNGVEIYEGDIVKYGNEKYNVFYGISSFMISRKGAHSRYLDKITSDYEVIGNIYKEENNE